MFLGTRSCFSVTETYCAIRPCETGKAVSPWELQQHTLQVGFLYPRAVAEHCFWSPPAVPKLNCGLSRGTEGWEGLLCPWFQEYLWTTTTAPKIYDDINVLNLTFWEVNGLAEQMDVTRCDGNAVLLAGRQLSKKRHLSLSWRRPVGVPGPTLWKENTQLPRVHT